MNSIYRDQGLRGFWVEDASPGQQLLQELRSGSGVSVLPWKPGSADKNRRMLSMTPLIESGRVWVPEEADWLEDGMQEIITIPNAKNDDQGDSLVITLDVLSRMVVVGMLRADPKGWAGSDGFAQAAQGFDWKGWGHSSPLMSNRWTGPAHKQGATGSGRALGVRVEAC